MRHYRTHGRKGEKMEKRKEIELEQQYAVISIPVNTVELKICAKIYLEGEIKEVHTDYDMTAVKNAVDEAEQGYIPSDATFHLTEKGKAIAELIDKGMSYEDACSIVDA